jgi:hypothetical protein
VDVAIENIASKMTRSQADLLKVLPVRILRVSTVPVFTSYMIRTNPRIQCQYHGVSFPNTIEFDSSNIFAVLSNTQTFFHHRSRQTFHLSQAEYPRGGKESKSAYVGFGDQLVREGVVIDCPI